MVLDGRSAQEGGGGGTRGGRRAHAALLKLVLSRSCLTFNELKGRMAGLPPPGTQADCVRNAASEPAVQRDLPVRL